MEKKNQSKTPEGHIGLVITEKVNKWYQHVFLFYFLFQCAAESAKNTIRIKKRSISTRISTFL